MTGSGRDRRIGLVFLGCGFVTRLHSRTLAGFEAEARRYYASRDAARAGAFNHRFGGAGTFASYEAALESRDIDVVLVATPPAQHLEWTLRALRSGKDVIVEKPAFLHSSDFDSVRAVQKETGRRVFVAENYFYKPVATRLRALLADDAVGEVLFLYVNALKEQATDGWRERHDQAGGGALFEGGIHWINFMANLGLSVRSVWALFPASDPGREKSALVGLQYEQGATGALFYSWEVPSPLRGLRCSRIYGRRGSIGFETNGLVFALWGRRKRVFFSGWRDLSGYRAMFRDFLGALRSGQEPAMTLERARRDLEIVEAAYRFAAGSRPLP